MDRDKDSKFTFWLVNEDFFVEIRTKSYLGEKFSGKSKKGSFSE